MSTKTMREPLLETEVRIESVRVAGRYRQDLGDVDELARSIRDIGLLNAITLTPDNRLVAGERRLEACRRLGWETIPARVVATLDSAVQELLAERDENTARKEMTITEKVALGAALEKLVEPVAADRRRAGAVRGGRASGAEQGSSPERRTLEKNPRTIDVVGAALGMGASTYARARVVVDAATTAEDETVRQVAEEAAARMDETGNVSAPYRRVRAAQAGEPVKQEPVRIRKPFPDVLHTATYKTAGTVEALHKLIRDDRFTHYALKATPLTRSDLQRAHQQLTEVLEAMSIPTLKDEHHND